MNPTPSNPVLDSSGHPPVETVAEYLEDLLPPDAAAQLDAHFADCPDCLDTRAALDEVRSLLGRTEPPTLPADIAARIDAALAAEALLSAAPDADETTADTPDEAARPDAPHRAHSAPSAPGRGPTAPTGPGSRHSRARRWRRAALGVAALAVAGLVSTAVLHLSADHTGSSASAGSAAAAGAEQPKSAAFPTSLTETDLPAQVRRLLPGSGPHPLVQPQSATAETAVAPCVLAAAGRAAETPLVQVASSYQGTPVFLLVYPSKTDPAHSVDAYLVAKSCSPGGGLLLHRVVARG